MGDADALNQLSRDVIGASLRVHRAVGGPGLLESVYQECLAYEMSLKGIPFLKEHPLPIRYGPVMLDCGFRLDFLVGDTLIVEVKAVEQLRPIHLAQMLTYLRLADCKLGLIVNFNVEYLPKGIRRVVNGFPG